jgi:DNA invertase Pin-like site-specific DNA recombinase
MAGKKTWAGIVRVSHMGDRKAGSEKVHTDRQQIAAIKNAVPDADRVEILPPELNVSGGLPLERRPSLRVAVEGVERGRYAGIIVAFQDRLFRNVEEEEAVWRRVEAAGGQVVLALDGIDTTTVNGRMLRRIKAAMNAGYREQHVERFHDLRRDATAAGVWQRRQTPTGYDKDPKTRKLVANHRAKDVRAAFLARGAGEGHSSLARKLGMTASGVRQMLRNRVYLGELRVGEFVNLTAHPPMVTEEEFLVAQHTVAPRPPRSKRYDGPALLAGLARCTGCGQVMARTAAKAVIYACHGHHSGGTCQAPAAITASKLDEHVQWIALAALSKMNADASRNNDRLREARARRKAAEREVAAYLEMVDIAGLGVQQAAAGLRKRQEALEQATEDEARELAARPVLVDGDPVRFWHEHPEHRNRLLRSLIEVVLVERSGGRGIVRPLEDRVRVVALGAGLVRPYGGGGRPVELRRIVLPDADDPRVLRVDLS